MRRESWRKLWLGLVTLGCFGASTAAWARKTNQSVYEEPFDLAGGGASLTRATQEAVLFANPALMPYGGKFHRWLGGQVAMTASREYADILRKLSSGDASPAEKSGDESVVDQALKAPIHFGAQTTFAYITNNFGLGVFARFEPDLEAKKRGDTGLPMVTISGEMYAGAVASMATAATRWLSFGVTGKYLAGAEPDIDLEATDLERAQQLVNDQDELRKVAPLGIGMGADVGALVFLQGRYVDYRWAVKVDDVGSTKLGDDLVFRQTVHTGMSVTFHGSTEALHLSADYRDVLGAYEEQPFKRTYLGAKLLLRNYVGLAAGLYQGIPSVGARIDLLLLKLGFTAYGREMGDYVGDRQRNLYTAYFSLGF